MPSINERLQRLPHAEYTQLMKTAPEALGVHAITFKRYITGKRDMPATVALEFSRMLGVTVEELLNPEVDLPAGHVQSL